MRGTLIIIAIAAGLVGLAGLSWVSGQTPAPSTASTSDSGIKTNTKPSGDVKLSFVRAGTVAKVLVKEGQQVKAGDLLMQQDDLVEQVALHQQKAKAKSDHEVRAAEADLEQKKVDLRKYEDSVNRNAGVVTQMELEHARLDVKIGELKVELSRFEREQNAMEVQKIQRQIDRMQIRSPIEGRVEELFLKQGESAEDGAKAVRVVNINPLYVDVFVPRERIATLARDLADGKEVSWTVKFQGDQSAAEGKVKNVSAAGDPASQTLLVRLEVPNPTLRAAGERVIVEVPPGSSDAKIAGAPVKKVP